MINLFAIFMIFAVLMLWANYHGDNPLFTAMCAILVVLIIFMDIMI